MRKRKTMSLYGAILRQTSKNAKTLKDSCAFKAVLKLWMAKTFEKISLFVKTISAKIFMYGRSHRCCQWKNGKNAQKTKGEDSREYVFPFPTLWPCVWVWNGEIQIEGYSWTQRLSTNFHAHTVRNGHWGCWGSETQLEANSSKKRGLPFPSRPFWGHS